LFHNFVEVRMLAHGDLTKQLFLPYLNLPAIAPSPAVQENMQTSACRDGTRISNCFTRMGRPSIDNRRRR